MSDFFNFGFVESKEKCNCLLERKDSIRYKCSFDCNSEQYFNDYIIHSNTENPYDVLFLTEFPEYKDNAQLRLLRAIIEKSGIRNYTIAPILRCYPKNRELKNPIVQYYKNCNLIDLNKIPNLDKYKTIVPLGTALYGITQCNHIHSWENFCQHLFDMPTYFYYKDMRRVYPLPSFHSFMHEMVTGNTNVYLRFDYRFFKIQLGKIKQYLDEYDYTRIERQPESIDVEVIKTENDVKDLLLNKIKSTDFAFDIETTGFLWWKDEIVCLTISNENFKSYFIDWKLMNEENKNLFNACFRTANKYITNAGKFDIRFLRFSGIPDAITNEDNTILHHLIYEDRPHTLDAMTFEFTRFGGYATEIEELRNKRHINNYGDIYKYYPKAFIKYSGYDSAISFYINPILREQAKRQDLLDYYETVMIPAIPTFTEIEMTGIKVDMVYMKNFVNDLKEKKVFLEKEIFDEIGEEINLSSKDEISKIMRKLNIPVAKDEKGEELTTKTGNYILNKNVIPLYSEYPFMFKLIEFNHICKLISQLGDIEKVSSNNIDDNSNKLDDLFNNNNNEDDSSLFEEENDFDGGFYKRIYNGILYPEFNLIGTKYGRISGSGGANLLNIPKSAEGKLFRQIFIPRENCVFGEKDYSNAEMRVVSIIGNETNMKIAIKDDLDMHCLTASKVANISYEEMFQKAKVEGIDKYKTTRQNAKCVHPSSWVVINNKLKRIGNLIKSNSADKFIPYKSLVLCDNENVISKSVYTGTVQDAYLLVSKRSILVASKNHKIKLSDGLMKSMHEIKKGDEIYNPQAYKHKFFNKMPTIKYNPFNINNNKKGLRISLTSDIAYICGLFVGDGSINGHCVRIATGQDGKYEYWKDSIRESCRKIGINGVYQTYSFKNIYLGSRNICKFFKELGLAEWKDKDNFKKLFRIPSWVFSNKKTLLQFLGGLIDSDGCVDKNGRVDITTKYWSLAQDIITAFQVLNFQYSVELSYNKTYNRNYFRVHILADSLYKLKNYNILRCVWKKERLDKRTNTLRCKKGYKIGDIVQNIEIVGKKRLIDLEIDNTEHLYRVNNIITHNSVNFGIIYGQTRFGLSRGLNKDIMNFNSQLKFDKSKGLRLNEDFKELISNDQAQEFIDAYFKAYPEIKTYISSYRQKAMRDGYIRNNFGRIAHLPQLYGLKVDPEKVNDKQLKEFFNVAINCEIQGTVGGCGIISMNRINNTFKRLGLKSRMILQVYDSILFEIVDGELDEVHKVSSEIMEYHYDWLEDMSMITDFDVGSCWGFGKSIEYWKENPNKYKLLVDSIKEKNNRNN